ncbi:MAG: hypothetical protein V1806_17425 [Pseudomonadota bacterium]
MSVRVISRLTAGVLLLAAISLLAACQAQKQTASERLARQWMPAKVAVLPFQVVEASGDDTIVRSPLTGSAFTAGAVTEGAAVALDQSLDNALPKMTGLSLVPFNQAGAVFERLRRQKFSLDMLQAAVETGKKLNAEGVLLGFVYRFAQRVGGPYAADRPASAAFDLAMVRVSDGAVVWKNSFDETQQSFADNVLAAGQYMDRGLRWFTVQEWGDIGLHQMLQRFPWRQEKAPE